MGQAITASTGALAAMSILPSGANTLPTPAASNIERPSFSLTGNQVSYHGETFANELKIFFITDTHLWQSDDREEPYRQYSQRMARAYNQTHHFQTKELTNPMEAFANTLRLAKEQEVDLLVLGGDILSYPSEAAVAWLVTQLEQVGIPFVYTSGNHDWHYEGMEGSVAALRETWGKKRLQPLYQGKDFLMAVRDVKGVRFVILDNSTYEIQPEQLAYFRQQTDTVLPVVLMQHIPLYVPGRSIGYGCGHPQWGYQTDQGYAVERRERWPKAGHTTTTMDFHREVFETPNLIGVFAGHIHTPAVDIYQGIPQCVAPANAEGGFLDIRFSLGER